LLTPNATGKYNLQVLHVSKAALAHHFYALNYIYSVNGIFVQVLDLMMIASRKCHWRLVQPLTLRVIIEKL
jgi:hypothetical protein